MLAPKFNFPLFASCKQWPWTVIVHLIGYLPLLAVAGVYFDPDVYMENEGYNVTLTLRINVTVNKRFGVLVNTVDDSAISMQCNRVVAFPQTCDAYTRKTLTSIQHMSCMNICNII